jgi:hypothetical protein
VESLEERTVLAAAVDFAPAETFFSGGPQTLCVAVGDFNNDGTPDLVVASDDFSQEDSSTLNVKLGDGFGGFAPPLTIATGRIPWYVVVGDFDSDGSADLAVTAVNSVMVHLGDGLGGFAAPLTFASGGIAPVSLAVTDFNNDGRADLAVVNQFTEVQGIFQPAVSVLLGDGTGAFGPPASFSTRTEFSHWTNFHESYSVATADFNGDNNADLAVTNSDPEDEFPSTVGVLLGDGMGGFAPATMFDSGGTIPKFVAVADFNNDGAPDLAVANQYGFEGGVLSSRDVGVLLGNGLGGFASAVNFDSGGSFPSAIAVGDFDNDGQADLAVPHATGNVAVLLGNGLGGFAAAETFGTGGSAPFSVAAADFNNDGRTDLAVANIDNASVGLLLNTTNQPPVNTVPGDQIVAEDVAKVISGLSVAGDGGVLMVILTVEHGTLTLNETVNGGLPDDRIIGNGWAIVTLIGTQAEINATFAAADGVTYQAALDYSGPDTLTMTTTDADGLSDTDAVAIDVHSAQQQAAELATFISGLGDAGVLKASQQASLLRKLDLLSTLTKPNKVEKMLQAFVNKVNRLVNREVLTAEQGDVLIEGAQSIVTSRQ